MTEMTFSTSFGPVCQTIISNWHYIILIISFLLLAYLCFYLPFKKMDSKMKYFFIPLFLILCTVIFYSSESIFSEKICTTPFLDELQITATPNRPIYFQEVTNVGQNKTKTFLISIYNNEDSPLEVNMDITGCIGKEIKNPTPLPELQHLRETIEPKNSQWFFTLIEEKGLPLGEYICTIKLDCEKCVESYSKQFTLNIIEP